MPLKESLEDIRNEYRFAPSENHFGRISLIFKRIFSSFIIITYTIVILTEEEINMYRTYIGTFGPYPSAGMFGGAIFPGYLGVGLGYGGIGYGYPYHHHHYGYGHHGHYHHHGYGGYPYHR